MNIFKTGQLIVQ